MSKHLPGVLYSYVHFVVELLCFFLLSSIVGDSWIIWLAPLVYDILAFVPQFALGAISDRFEKIPFGVIGMSIVALGLVLFSCSSLSAVAAAIIIALGNACVHVNGAEVTLRHGQGKIAPAAIFVAGGSFGVVAGKLLVNIAPLWALLALAASTIPIMIYAEKYRKVTAKQKLPCKAFDFANKNLPLWLLISATTFVVMIRSYVGYGIPTSWNKTIPQTIALFAFMGIGKGLGGILVDKIGIRKTSIISMLGALPFLLLGDNIMSISLIGVMFFSMTMAITLATLVSVHPKNPGMAFGYTTIGLALGSLPIFFFRITDTLTNCIVITIASIICLFILLKVTKKEVKHV